MPKQQKPKHKIAPPSPPQRKEVPTLPRRLLGVTDAPDGAHPSWRLSFLDLEHAGSWSWRITEDTLQQIITFLTEMERLKWSEVRAQNTSSKSGSHRKHHSVAVERLCPQAQRRLTAIKLDDFDELFRFRLGNKPRLWGVVNDDVFYPVWWDPEHQVYPTDPS